MLIAALRYIYIPLGGSKRVLLNSLLVSSFVALWHDLTFRLLAWGWLVTLFVVPEIIGRKLLPESRVRIRCASCILFSPSSPVIHADYPSSLATAHRTGTSAPSAACSTSS